MGETLPVDSVLLAGVMLVHFISLPPCAGPADLSAPMEAPDKPPTRTIITVRFTLPASHEQIRWAIQSIIITWQDYPWEPCEINYTKLVALLVRFLIFPSPSSPILPSPPPLFPSSPLPPLLPPPPLSSPPPPSPPLSPSSLSSPPPSLSPPPPALTRHTQSLPGDLVAFEYLRKVYPRQLS